MQLQPHSHHVRDSFDDLNDLMQSTLSATRMSGHPIFTFTPKMTISDLFIKHLPWADRQYHNCRACLAFLNKYGSAVILMGKDAQPILLLWDMPNVPRKYRATFDRVRTELNNDLREQGAAVLEPLVTSQFMGHTPTGQFTHFSLRDPAPFSQDKLHKFRDAEQRLKYANYTPTLLATAEQILQVGGFRRAASVEPQINFLIEYYNADPANRKLLLVKASEALTHPNSSMIGTLLDDLLKGKSIDACTKAFNDKMDPLKYQRPTAPVSAQVLKQAEQLFADDPRLQVALHRCFLQREHIPQDALLWLPSSTAQKDAPVPAVFSTVPVKGKSVKKQILAEKSMTYAVFARDILPRAACIEWKNPGDSQLATLVQSVPRLDGYDAGLMLRWDGEVQRNTASWWFHSKVQASSTFGMNDQWQEVRGIIKSPAAWHNRQGDTYGRDVFFVLKGAGRNFSTHSGLFPELLRGELHPFKRVIELHNNNNSSQRSKFWVTSLADWGTALGVGLEKPVDDLLRVTFHDGLQGLYRLTGLE